MYRKEYGKMILCADCGQIGLPVVNAGTRTEKRYVCKEKEPCRRRLERSKTAGVMCSYWFCLDSAAFNCSCGMKLCKLHKRMLTHMGHRKTKIK